MIPFQKIRNKTKLLKPPKASAPLEMDVEETLLGNLSTDLILNIISRLSPKYVARCRCLSKLWASLLTSGSPYFTELFLNHSKTRPRLLLAVHNKDDEWYLYSCPQPQISYKIFNLAISVTAEFHMSIIKSRLRDIFTPITGLIYCSNLRDYNNSPMLCNPSTRKLLWLPELAKIGYSFFGYDPIDKQCSALSISYASVHGQPLRYQILKLGSERLSWRDIECSLHHTPYEDNICINGILYYFANFGSEYPLKIACFDFNSEEFKFIDFPWLYGAKRLLNFKGKLCGTDIMLVKSGKRESHLKLSFWVLEDVETQEWSKRLYCLPSSLWHTNSHITIVGVTVTGEVVLSLKSITHPFYVYFLSLEENILRKVEIKGLEGFPSKIDTFSPTFFKACVDYVEDLKDLNRS